MLIKDNKNQHLGVKDHSLIKLINEKPDLFTDITIIEFAKRAKTSASVISKFIRKLNFESYREFQNHLTREKMISENSTRISLESNALIISNNNFGVENYDHYFLSKTINNLNYSDFTKLVEKIVVARRIWVIGDNHNHLAALDLANSLLHLGKVAFSTNNINDLSLQANYLSEQDLVIFISENWKNTSYHELSKELRNKKIITATITAINKFLVPVTDLIVTFYSPIDLNERPSFYNAKIQELFINNILIQAVAKQIN